MTVTRFTTEWYLHLLEASIKEREFWLNAGYVKSDYRFQKAVRYERLTEWLRARVLASFQLKKEVAS